MEILSEFANVLIAAVAVAFVTFITSRQYRDLKDGVRELRHDMRDGFSRVDSELARLRSDITQVALAAGAHRRPETG